MDVEYDYDEIADWTEPTRRRMATTPKTARVEILAMPRTEAGLER
jgi:hypothetical protein